MADAGEETEANDTDPTGWESFIEPFSNDLTNPAAIDCLNI